MIDYKGLAGRIKCLADYTESDPAWDAAETADLRTVVSLLEGMSDAKPFAWAVRDTNPLFPEPGPWNIFYQTDEPYIAWTHHEKVPLYVHPAPQPRPAQPPEGATYGIIDPDYGRVYTIARKLAWEEGYAIGLHGSFTRDLDMIAVPWADTACEPEHLIRRIADATGLKVRDGFGVKPHGRLAWTLKFPAFGDPRFIDLSVMPRVLPKCGCRACLAPAERMSTFVICPQCGDKRCPRADDHRNACVAPQPQPERQPVSEQADDESDLVRIRDVMRKYGWQSRDCCEEILALFQPQPVSEPTEAQIEASQAALDVLAERRRQVEAEGWTPAHDDKHIGGQMAMAAACYAAHAAVDECIHCTSEDTLPSLAVLLARAQGFVAQCWPWSHRWWKPSDRRRNLVKAGALILAEIERLDRAALAAKDAT